MAPNFSKNAILKGDIDFFCLVCEVYIISTTECEEHISTADHEKNISINKYDEEFKEECIRKIKNKYFCELCNKLLPLLLRVKLHINEPTHIENKNIGWLKRVDGAIVAFNEIVIDDAAWHGFSDNSCIVCNTEFKNSEIHKKISTHILNLLQMKVDFDKEKNIYRKIDEFSFQCLTCNIVQYLSDIRNHFDSPAHKQLLQACHETHKLLKVNIEMSHKSNSEFKDDGNKSVEQTEKCQLSKNPVDIEKHTSTEKNDSKTTESILHVENKDLKPNMENIESNSKDSSKNAVVCEEEPKNDSTFEFDDTCEERICKVLKTNNYITLDNNNMSWCILCDWLMNSSKIEEHVNGKHHNFLLKLHKNREAKLKEKYANNTNNTKNNESTINMRILDSLSEFQKNNIEINFETKTAVCKKCSINLDYDYDIIENHILKHSKLQQEQHKNQKKKKKGKKSIIFPVEKVPEKKGRLFSSPVLLNCDMEKEKPLEVNVTEESGKIENDKENGSETNIKYGIQTIDGEATQKETQIFEETSSSQKIKKTKECTVEKISTIDFIESIIVAKDIIQSIDFHDIIINNKICVNFFTLLYFTFNGENFKCHLCEVTFFPLLFEEHCETPKHDVAMRDTPVLIQYDSEFIREIRPGCFHCGFCNEIVSSLEKIEAHLNSLSHRECKGYASWRLQQYQPEIAKNQYETVFSAEFFAKNLTRKLFN
ncbi:unnamed protein product [Euphydryas editha]|uniref:C2H2-type domain-containing protein n=1 Tax=Euphydryas editha TaxID=104508 RepID=A0AAU9UG92_EUPED|nr:unnamed protein product [Euphydryas editha]